MSKKSENLFSMEELAAPIRVRAKVVFYNEETDEEPRVGRWYAHFRRSTVQENERLRDQVQAEQEKIESISVRYSNGEKLKDMSPEDRGEFRAAQEALDRLQDIAFDDLVSWEVRSPNGKGLMPVDPENKEVLLSMPEMKVSIRAAWRKAQQMRLEVIEKNS